MKNILIVDIDTERENQIMFGKNQDYVMPETDEEMVIAMEEDIKTLVEALNHLLIYSNNGHIRADIAKYLTSEEAISETNELPNDGTIAYEELTNEIPIVNEQVDVKE